MKVDNHTIRTWKHRGVIPNEVLFKPYGFDKSRATVRYIKSKLIDWINGNLKKEA